MENNLENDLQLVQETLLNLETNSILAEVQPLVPPPPIPVYVSPHPGTSPQPKKKNDGKDLESILDYSLIKDKMV